MTVVLDTNLWVSALVRPQTPPGRTLDAFLQKMFLVSTTEHLWDELLRALTYDAGVEPERDGQARRDQPRD